MQTGREKPIRKRSVLSQQSPWVIVIVIFIAIGSYFFSRKLSPQTGSSTIKSTELSLEDEVRKAREGDPAAMARIGIRYYFGDQVEKDVEEAERLLRKAAAQGDPTAIKAIAKYFPPAPEPGQED
jgi:hypothetical protein